MHKRLLHLAVPCPIWHSKICISQNVNSNENRFTTNRSGVKAQMATTNKSEEITVIVIVRLHAKILLQLKDTSFFKIQSLERSRKNSLLE